MLDKSHHSQFITELSFQVRRMSVRGRSKVLSYSGVLTTPQEANPANMVVKYPLSKYFWLRHELKKC